MYKGRRYFIDKIFYSEELTQDELSYMVFEYGVKETSVDYRVYLDANSEFIVHVNDGIYSQPIKIYSINRKVIERFKPYPVSNTPLDVNSYRCPCDE